MQHQKPIYPDYLLQHGRESRKLTIQEVAGRTGIAVKDYAAMEAGYDIISTTEAALLGALLKLNPQYITAHNMQLQLLYAAKHMLDMEKKKMASLTAALKKKIKSGK